jgi:hypothetical protein
MKQHRWLRFALSNSAGSDRQLIPSPRASWSSETFDRVMNWIVGALLVAATMTVAIAQAHPPR